MNKRFRFGNYYIGGMLAVAFTGLFLTMLVAISGFWIYTFTSGVTSKLFESIEQVVTPWAFLVAVGYGLRLRRIWAHVIHVCILFLVAIASAIGIVVYSNWFLLAPCLGAVAAALYFLRWADQFPGRPRIAVGEAKKGYISSSHERKLRRIWTGAVLARYAVGIFCVLGLAGLSTALGDPISSEDLSSAFVSALFRQGIWMALALGFVLEGRGTRILLLELITGPAFIVVWSISSAPILLKAIAVQLPLVIVVYVFALLLELAVLYLSYRLRQYNLAFRTRREELAQLGGQPVLEEELG